MIYVFYEEALEPPVMHVYEAKESIDIDLERKIWLKSDSYSKNIYFGEWLANKYNWEEKEFDQYHNSLFH